MSFGSGSDRLHTLTGHGHPPLEEIKRVAGNATVMKFNQGSIRPPLAAASEAGQMTGNIWTQSELQLAFAVVLAFFRHFTQADTLSCKAHVL